MQGKQYVLPSFVFLCVMCFATAFAADNWPNWRGPTFNGVAPTSNPPTTWSETENIKWKYTMPGESSSTPIVWGEKMFIQVAVQTNQPDAKADTEPEPESSEGRRSRRGGGRSNTGPSSAFQFKLICLNKDTGEVIWERTAREAVPHEGHHPTSTYAPFSAVTDGEQIWASFGSQGLFCYDLNGNPKWSTELMEHRMRNSFGEGSSPALVGDYIVILMDHEGESKISAFNKDTGELAWESERQEPSNWTTPIPVRVGDQLQIVVNATNYVRGYDAANGEIIWQCTGQTLNVIPTPLLGFGNVYCTSGFRGAAFQAIELGRTGDLTNTDAIVWEVDRDTPYVASPLLYDDKVYFLSSTKPNISCYNAETGEEYYATQRLAGLRTIYASPLGAGGHVYIADRDGSVMVVKHGETFEEVATNKLDDIFDGSPIAIGDNLYLKGHKFLYCIAE